MGDIDCFLLLSIVGEWVVTFTLTIFSIDLCKPVGNT